MLRRLCLECADRDHEPPARFGKGLNYSVILISVGVIIVLLSALADRRNVASTPGFGWKQDIVVVLSGLLVVIATLLRIPTLAVIGLLAGVLSLLADVFQFGSDPGFGWYQMGGLFAGLITASIGMQMARRKT